MASWFWIAFGLSMLALAGCTASGGLSPTSLPSYGVVPDFALTDQSNQPFLSANTLRGKVWIADFIFTNCAGPCPRMSAQMRKVDDALRPHISDLRLVSFTVDPARDTPEVLAKYAEHYQAEPGVWFFLTGPRPTLHNLARNVFLLGDVNGDLEHSTRFVLIDRQSRVRGYYLTSDDDAIPKLIADAKRVAKDRF
jgi:protein SCO1/2